MVSVTAQIVRGEDRGGLVRERELQLLVSELRRHLVDGLNVRSAVGRDRG